MIFYIKFRNLSILISRKIFVQNKVTFSMQADNWTDLNTCGIPCECLSLIKMNILAVAGMSFAPY
jgi:hypothetical protein